MASKPSAPGRRGSSNVAKFQGADKLVEGIDPGLRRVSRGGTVPDDVVDREEAEAAAAAADAEAAQAAAQAAWRQEEQAAAQLAAAAARRQEEQAAAQLAAAAARRQEEQAAAELAAQKQYESEAAAQLERQQQEQQQQQEQNERKRKEEQAKIAEAAAAAELQRQQQENEAAAAVAAQEQRERETAAAIEAQRLQLERKREAEREAELAAAATEAEAERLASLERANEAARAAAAISVKDSAELEAARRKADEVRRKREMFLSDMDEFSTTFEAKSSEAEEAKRLLAEQEAEKLSGQMRGASVAYVAPELRQPQVESALPKYEDRPAEAGTHQVPAPASTAVSSQSSFPSNDDKKQAFESLSSSLFATSNVAAAESSPSASAATGAETLRMPTRIGQKGPSLVPAAPPAPYQAEDEEDEGAGGDESLSNVLTKAERRNLSPTERAQWRALQTDLTTRRREFHGAVTYAFDGIFSWQMYGSAEAVDETGSAYTEYLMRCQWGTSWENMQPWISARRYREFDTLDQDLKRCFPAMENGMPRLPAKDFFRFLEQDVIEKRRSALENYMTRVVGHLPTILRSEQVSDFLGIRERIATIKQLLGEPGGGGGGGASPAVGRRGAAPAPMLERRTSVAQPPAPSSSASPRGASPPLPPAEGRMDLDDRCGLILSIDAAEAAKSSLGATFFIDSELSSLEEQVRDLTFLLRSASPQELLFKNQRAYYLLSAVTADWPRLRATTGSLALHMLIAALLVPSWSR